MKGIMIWKKALLYVCLSSISLGLQTLNAQRKIVVDADTGNEVDDFFALARLFMEPTLEITTLNAAHWQGSQWAIPNTMENSHRLNQQLLGEMNLSIPTKRGAIARMFDWGDRAQHSSAAYELIAQCKSSDRITVVVLGALTNVASAIYIAPDIAKKLDVYWLGTEIDFKTGVLKRNDFNPMMDPYALDLLLESEAELHIVPLNTAVAMQVDFDEMNKKIGDHFLGSFLMDRWKNHLDGSRRNRILWDLGLVAVFINPDFGSTQTITTSKDSGNRPIVFYDSLDAKAIYNDFYSKLLAYKKSK